MPHIQMAKSVNNVNDVKWNLGMFTFVLVINIDSIHMLFTCVFIKCRLLTRYQSSHLGYGRSTMFVKFILGKFDAHSPPQALSVYG